MSKFELPSAVALVISIVFSQPAASATRLPDNFRWCVATAAHQIEGMNTASDWWKWEQEPNHVKTGETSGLATDHWNRVDEDISLMKALNVTDYRMSIEWARIEPKEGQLDRQAIEHYRAEIQSLITAGIRPMVTLQHFTFPLWVRENGGFEWDGLPEAFERYTKLVYSEIAPEVADWVTINEPLVTIHAGYIAGDHPPSQHREWKDVVPLLQGIARVHARAYHALHDAASARGRRIRVGMAHHLRTEDPATTWNPIDWLAASIADQVWNWTLPTALETGRITIRALWIVNHDEEIPGLAHTQDFLGINYYSGDLVSFSPSKGLIQKPREGLPKSDLGWPIYPEGFYRLMKATAERFPGKPILITENGIADASDSQRTQFLRDHLGAVARAINEGVPVEGYCHWSLLDNFEWQEGFTPRFGLYEIDYKTLKRTPRPSAKFFSEAARRNGL